MVKINCKYINGTFHYSEKEDLVGTTAKARDGRIFDITKKVSGKRRERITKNHKEYKEIYEKLEPKLIAEKIKTNLKQK
ncbi:MAG: hypothetical protein Q8936_01770 [Bacillota bacterium]|nr:hypothetical protein [Bacillota bacterium]